MANFGGIAPAVLVDDIERSLQHARAAIRQLPKVQPWGLRDVVVADPDSNTFEIAQPVGQ